MAPTRVYKVAADLHGVLVFDHPDRFELLTLTAFDQLGISVKEAFDRAVENTRRFLEPEETACVKLNHNSIGKLDRGNVLESSRLLHYGWWSSVSDAMEGDLLVTAPDQRVVLYTDSANDDARLIIQTLANRIVAASDAPLSRTVLTWDVDGWVVMPPPAGV
jgi:uncharacterized protein YtpQ (UPF0354 family)